VFGGLNRLLVAALVAGAFFVAPSAALACSGGPSAENVYKECLPNGGGGSAGSGGAGGGQGSTPISNQTAKVLAQAGKDSRALAALVKHNPNQLESTPQESGTAPSAVGSAFDLGSGPTALLIALAVTAVLLLAATGLRGWRRVRG
jgi:hypothetical protein